MITTFVGKKGVQNVGKAQVFLELVFSSNRLAVGIIGIIFANYVSRSGYRCQRRTRLEGTRTLRGGGQTMLVLTRRAGERILIDGRIQIQVVSIKGNSIRIGIEAPPDVSILRQELVANELDLPAGPAAGSCG